MLPGSAAVEPAAQQVATSMAAQEAYSVLYLTVILVSCVGFHLFEFPGPDCLPEMRFSLGCYFSDPALRPRLARRCRRYLGTFLT